MVFGGYGLVEALQGGLRAAVGASLAAAEQPRYAARACEPAPSRAEHVRKYALGDYHGGEVVDFHDLAYDSHARLVGVAPLADSGVAEQYVQPSIGVPCAVGPGFERCRVGKVERKHLGLYGPCLHAALPYSFELVLTARREYQLLAVPCELHGALLAYAAACPDYPDSHSLRCLCHAGVSRTLPC